MNRTFAFLAAAFLSTITIGSVCTAAGAESLGFSLEPKSGDQVQLSIDSRSAGSNSNWSTSLGYSELVGLAPEIWRQPARAIRFALVREAGRLDCSGTAASRRATGTCDHSPNPQFVNFLRARGIGNPTFRQAHALTMSGATRAQVEALRANGYRTPSVDDVVALGIFNVSPGYVRDLAAAGYRVGTAEELVGFKIHKVTPDLIRSYRALGYDRLPADDLVSMAIHGVTPEFINRFARLGYREIPAEKLVELRIFGVTADEVRALESEGVRTPNPDQLIRLRVADFGPQRIRRK